MSKVIFILIDALEFRASEEKAGYLEHLTECGKAAKYRVRGELPSSSRPVYETLMTGLPTDVHGITTNFYTCPSHCENLFSLTKKHGLVNAAAAYKWIFELYGGHEAYDLRKHRFQLEGCGDIHHGIFYHSDDYPDTHLYLDGDFLRKTYNPDFLFIHPMNVDDQGHKCGLDSRQYQHAVEISTEFIALLLEEWLADGYDIVVTGDHGMDTLGLHSGNTPLQREVPLYIVSNKVAGGDFSDKVISQLNVAPLICYLLGIPHAEKMIAPAEIRRLDV